VTDTGVGLAPDIGHFTPGRNLGTHGTGGWVAPRAGLVGCGKSRAHRDSIPRPSSPQRVALRTTSSRPTYMRTFVLFTVTSSHFSKLTTRWCSSQEMGNWSSQPKRQTVLTRRHKIQLHSTPLYLKLRHIS